jgi:hypothetical protein
MSYLTKINSVLVSHTTNVLQGLTLSYSFVQLMFY